MAQQPTGTVTFLFTDIEGSTRRWDTDAEAMQNDLASHDEILRAAIQRHGGHVFATGGDGFAAAFVRAADALDCAADAQAALQATELPPVRMGVHTGEAVERDGDYFGPPVNRAARLMSIAHGGQVVFSAATAELASDVTAIDLGEHRLRDLSRAERVHQLVIEGLPDRFPPLRSVDTSATNLPVELTSFIGRDDAVRDVGALVTGDHRLVSLIGVGGVGKTRLALHVAGEVLGSFADGAWLCELAPAGDEAGMAEAIASTLGVAPRSGMSVARSIVEWLRPRQMLLVLDNCEHLVDPVGAFVEDVLSDCRGVRLLVTSREALAVAGEQVWPLKSLVIPPTDVALDAVLDSPAARLFAERARSVAPDLQLDDNATRAIGEICRRLDGIPLAIELAAARAVAMHPTEIASLLDERFRLLTGSRRRGVERHQTLRAMVDWSYSMLDERAATLFDRLGVFAGSFDADAVVSVAVDDVIGRFDVIDALTDLVAKSMVTVAGNDAGHTRYQMLETLRQYALDRLEGRGDAEQCRRRHAGCYAALAEAVGPGLAGPDDIAARSRLLLDVDNFRAAVNWALDAPDDADAALGLRIIAAAAYLVTTARAAGLGSWAERAVPRTRAVDGPLVLAVVGAAIYSAADRGDFVAGQRYCDLLDEWELTAECPAPALAAGGAAIMTQVSIDLARGTAMVHEAVTRLDAIGDRYGSITLRAVAVIFETLTGDEVWARGVSHSVVADAREFANATVLATALFAFGLAWQRERPHEALAALEECVAGMQRSGNDIVFGEAYTTIAALRSESGDTVGALRAMATAVRYAYSVGNLPSVRFTARTLLEILCILEAFDEAATLVGITDAGGLHGVGFDPLTETEAHERPRAHTRLALGAARYEARCAAGAQMPLLDVVAFMEGSIAMHLEALEGAVV